MTDSLTAMDRLMTTIDKLTIRAPHSGVSAYRTPAMPPRTKSQLYTIPKGALVHTISNGDWSNDPTRAAFHEACMFTLKYVVQWLCSGDVVQFCDIGGGLINDGKILYYNNYLYQLSDDLDDYGHLPSICMINAFDRADYFSESINGNRIVWVRFDTLIDHNTYSVIMPPDHSDPKISGPVHRIHFSRGWTLITNVANYAQRPCTYASDFTFVVPDTIDHTKLIYCIDEEDMCYPRCSECDDNSTVHSASSHSSNDISANMMDSVDEFDSCSSITTSTSSDEDDDGDSDKENDVHYAATCLLQCKTA